MIDFTQLNNTFFYDTDKQYVIDVFNTACIVATSFLFSSIFISIYGINDAYDWYDDDEPDIPYENKYPIDTIDNNIDTEFIPNKSNFICESTPNGTVFMRYDKDNNGFDYWCNDNQIEYKYLETVARKFIKFFNCKHLYVDREKDIQQQKLELELKDISDNVSNKNEIVNDDDDDDDDDDVFVKPKPIVNNNKKEKQDNIIIPRNSNKFIKKGKVNELTNNLLFPNGKIVKEHKKFSFSDYKKLFQ
tara:strand:- start:1559 stop:2296 length:738 start_codon:yes stop_codon:yes gene_type:complete